MGRPAHLAAGTLVPAAMPCPESATNCYGALDSLSPFSEFVYRFWPG